MNTELQEFFSLIGKAKKEKDDEFKSLVGDINIDSLFTQVKESVKEDKKRKEKEHKKIQRQVKALESWLYSEPKPKPKIKVETIVEDSSFEIVDLILPKPLKNENDEEIERIAGDILNVSNENVSEIEENIENLDDLEKIEEDEIQENDTVDHALKILEQIKTKEEVQENTTDPEILKIRRELEYLKNIINAQGGGGEVRLEFLDDIDRDTAKTNNYYLKYDASIDKWIGAPGGGGGGTQSLNDTLGYGNTSNIGMSVGVVTATYFVGDGSLLTNVPGSSNSGYANTAGIATYASTAGIATYASNAGVATYSNTAGIATYASIAGIATYASIAGIATYATNAGIATYATTAGISTTSQGLTGIPNIIVGVITATSLGLGAGSIISGIVTTTTTSETAISSINSVIFRSATYQIQITEGTNYNMTTINAIHDGSVTYMSEYGTINQPVGIATFSTDINSGFLRLLAYPNSSNTTTFKVILTAIQS